MNTPSRPEWTPPAPTRGVPSLRPVTERPGLRPDRDLPLGRYSGLRRLPDFSIFLPRDPSVLLPQGIPASSLRRSGFVL